MDEGGLGPLVSNTWPPLNATECNWMHLDAPSVLAKPSWDSPESISESNETSKLKMWHKDMVADLSFRWSYFTSVDPGIPFSFRVAVAVNEYLRAWHNDMFDFICLYLSHDRNAQLRENLCSLIGNRSRSMMLTWSCITIAQLLITKRSSDLNSTSLLTCLKLDTLGVWVLDIIRLEKNTAPPNRRAHLFHHGCMVSTCINHSAMQHHHIIRLFCGEVVIRIKGLSECEVPVVHVGGILCYTMCTVYTYNSFCIILAVSVGSCFKDIFSTSTTVFCRQWPPLKTSGKSNHIDAKGVHKHVYV